MRVIAYYQHQTPALSRRVLGVFGVLNGRGKAAHYSYCFKPEDIKMSGYDIVLLSDWRHTGTLPSIQGSYVYDLSSADLLDDSHVVHVMQQCRYALAPSEAIAKLTRQHIPTLVQPSSVHIEALLQQRVVRPESPLIALLKPCDWRPILNTIEKVLAGTTIKVVTDDIQLAQALPEGKAIYLQDIDMRSHMMALRSCFLVLMPGTTAIADPALAWEFGLVGAPAIVSPVYSEAVVPNKTGIVANSEGQWSAALTRLIEQDRLRSLYGQEAQSTARQYSATRQADRWWQAVARFCATTAD